MKINIRKDSLVISEYIFVMNIFKNSLRKDDVTNNHRLFVTNYFL
jgi:hypothetical protein